MTHVPAHDADEPIGNVLRVDVSAGPLRAEYDRICRRLMERSESVPEIPEDARLEGSYDPRAVAMAVANWRSRMRQEHNSAAVFAGMLPQMIAAGCTVDLKACALRCGIDELRHAALCGQVVRLLGADPSVESSLEVAPLADHPGVPWSEKVLRNLLFVGCLSETVAVAVLTDERTHTREPAIARVLKQLAGDETLHARIGWIYLREAFPALDAEARARTNEYLAVALGYYERCILSSAQLVTFEPDVLAQARALGFAYGLECREIVYATLQDVVIPQLNDVGFDATGAWARRKDANRNIGPRTLLLD